MLPWSVIATCVIPWLLTSANRSFSRVAPSLAFLLGPGVGQADVDGVVQVEPLAVPGRDDGVLGDVGVVAVFYRAVGAWQRRAGRVRRVAGRGGLGRRLRLRGNARRAGDGRGRGEGIGADVHDDLVHLAVIGFGHLPGQERLGDAQQRVGQAGGCLGGRLTRGRRLRGDVRLVAVRVLQV